MMTFAQKLLRRLARDERGLTAVEYAVLGGFVVVAIAAAGAVFNTELEAAFQSMFDQIPAPKS